MGIHHFLSRQALVETEDPATPQTPSQHRSASVAVDDEHNQALRGATVMMVDDEPTTVEVLQAFLENEGYQRFVTTNESSCAMDLVESENPDVLLLDLHMPGVNGFDILSFMREDKRYRHTPVIVLTSATDSETKLKALQLGASDFLAKPVDPSELALRLRNTLAAKAYQDRLTYYDVLTGVPNRQMFMDRLVWALRCAKRDGIRGAVLHIDLDHFQKINDSLGHVFGDRLLVEVAQRLVECVACADVKKETGLDESGPMVSRVGGDEFNILLPETPRVESAAVMATNVIAAMKGAFQIDGREVFITPSIGIAVFPNDGEINDVLIKHAGVATRQAKQHGRNNYEFYSAKMNVKALESLSLENHLRRALERDELLLVYQPKVELCSGRIVGAEALLRWRSPELGLVSPAEFIPVAEETGLIVAFGEWVLRAACAQNKAWQAAGLSSIRIAANVSARQFHDARFLQTLRGALTASGLEPQWLTLEITENIVMGNAQENLGVLKQIKEMGVKLSVDDFGTGYSSLSYLTRLPLDELKIDRSFISGIRSETDDAPIVTAIVAMAHSLGLRVVVEGVETTHQVKFSRSRGCDECQGFLFSKPVPGREFEIMLSEGVSHMMPNP